MSDWISISDRLRSMPPYIFSEINAIKAEAEKRGVSLLSLAIGDPDQPTPAAIVEKLHEATSKSSNHAYSPYEGTLAFRRAVAAWFERRFGVGLSPEKEVVALIGSKEGLAHFPLSICNSGDRALYPSPGYPIFQTCILLAGGVPIAMPHLPEDGFLPDPKRFESLVQAHGPKFAILNYPCNPTTAVCPKATLEALVAIARRHQVVLAYDNAYSEMYYDAGKRPPSLLEIPGAKEVAIEFHSFSKTFNMTGWRLGFTVGNEKLVQALLKVKTNIDSGPLLAVQEAGIFALENAEMLCAPIRRVYDERREFLLSQLGRIGIEYCMPEASFFVWAKVPGGMPSMEFTKALISREGLVVTPGIGFGEHGEGFFRLSMTVAKPELEEAARRLERFLSRS